MKIKGLNTYIFKELIGYFKLTMFLQGVFFSVGEYFCGNRLPIIATAIFASLYIISNLLLLMVRLRDSETIEDYIRWRLEND